MRYQKKKSNRKKLIAILSSFIVLMVGFSAISSFISDKEEPVNSEFTKNAATSITGALKDAEEASKVTEYWQVLLGGKPVALMKNELSAKGVIEHIRNKYAEEGATDIKLEPAMTIEKVEFKQGDSIPTVMDDSAKVAEKLLTGNVRTSTYEVQEGDSLWGIANDNDTDIETILDTNPQIDPEELHVGDKINFTEGEPDVKVLVTTVKQETQEIDYEVVYEETSDLYEGEEEVVTEGVVGQKNVSLSVTKMNGIVQNSEVLEETVEQEPVTMVVRVGTAVREDYSDDSDYSDESTYEDYSDDATSSEDSSSEDSNDDSSDEGGYEESVSSSNESSIRQTIVNAALAQLGIDQSCTQLVSSSLEAAGISCWTGPSGFASLGSWTDNPEPGDICIYTSHVALYIGDGQAVHGGWVGDGPRTTAIWGVHLSWPTFLGYIHLDL